MLVWGARNREFPRSVGRRKTPLSLLVSGLRSRQASLVYVKEDYLLTMLYSTSRCLQTPSPRPCVRRTESMGTSHTRHVSAC